MGQRSQIYVRINGKLVVAQYYQWNYAEHMISRAKGIVEFLDEYLKGGHMDCFTRKNVSSYAERLRRVCDVNFDMRAYQMSADIVKEWREEFPEKPFGKYVFDEQDNNDGQLFIDVQGDKIKYCFTKWTRRDKTMNGGQYMAWDHGGCTVRNWTIPTEYRPQETIDLCKANIKYISEHAELMTVDELREFVHADYEQATAA